MDARRRRAPGRPLGCTPQERPLMRVFAFSLLFLISVPAQALVWPDVAERVARDLSAAEPPTRRGRLAIAALDDPDDDVRLAAADAAIRLRAAGATDKVAAWLNAPDARLRREAYEVARSLPSPRVVAPLARTLGDPDPEVRGAAAEALGHQ